MRNLFLRVVFAIAFISLASIQLIGQNPIKVEQYVLENGLHVYLHEDHSKPQVFGGVITRAGGKNDPSDATGMAHYMEHMLFKGTTELGTIDWEKEKPHIDKIFSLYEKLRGTKDEEERKNIQIEINKESLEAAKYAIPNELSNVINSMGGTNLNAGTGPDQTMFYNAFPSSQTERWLDLYAHRFINPVFRSFQAELEVVYEEKNMYQDMFFSPILEKFNKNFFKNHPYGQQTLIGTAEDLKNPSLNKMLEFYNTYYVANNMGLVISGDFNTEEILPMIKSKFGVWKSGKLPEAKVYAEVPFNGREFIEGRMSPIKLGILGFRTVPNGHADEVALEVMNQIMANQSQTGLFDKLALDNKIMAVQSIPMQYNDHGAGMILFIPKLIGQKLEDAEAIVHGELDKVKKGEFEDWMIESIKKQLYKSYMSSMESNQSKALTIANAYSIGMDLETYLSYPDKVNKITKEDVIRVAKKYYGENYLAFYSKMGSIDKDKIDKPGYEPLKVNTNAISSYVEQFSKIPFVKKQKKYIDFGDALLFDRIPGGRLYATTNPKNDIFSLKIKYGVGNEKFPMLEYATQMMDLAGTEKYSVNELKQEFAKIGCTYSIYSDDSYLTIYVSGIEKYFPQAVLLINELVNNPKLDPSKMEILYEGEKTNRKMERSEADNVGDALFSYVRYGDNSEYLDRLTLKEIKSLSAEKMISTFKEACKYEAEIYFAGNTDNPYSFIMDKLVLNPEPIKSNSPVVKELNSYTENEVYFVHKKKSRQSKIYYYTKGMDYNPQNQAAIKAFNVYFGGGFSGLVLQEVREYRSLAYSAGSQYSTPQLLGKPCTFYGFIGTQADKTSEGLEVFNGLVRDMPQKPERMEMINDYLVLSNSASMPSFRSRTETVQAWKRMGYKQDPSITLEPAYQNVSFDDILKFYNSQIKEKPMTIAIVGNKKNIDMDALKKYGTIIKMKEKKLFSK